jgi:hypothetical protein
MREGKGRGPGRPGAHPELAGGVEVAGGGRSAVNSEVAALGFLARNGDGGGDSRRPGSITSARNKRRTRQSSSYSRRGRGRRGAARLGGGHGGRAQSLGGVHGRAKASACAGKREGKRGKESWHPDASPGGSSRPPSGKQKVATVSALRRTRRSLPSGGRRQVHFVDSPLGFGGFSGNLKTVRFCKI